MSIKIDDNTSIGLPLRNLIGLVAAVVVGAWFAFGVIERLNALETANKLFIFKNILSRNLNKSSNRPKNLYIHLSIIFFPFHKTFCPYLL